MGLWKRVAVGASWVIFQRFSIRGIGLISTVILARLLAPADFGIVALTTAIVAALESFSEIGLDLALIRNQSADRRHYDVAWTLSIVRGAFISLVLLAGARSVSAFYNDHRLTSVMAWLALASFIGGLRNIGIIEFRKELQFDREFHLLVLAKLVGFAVTLALAVLWRDYRALVAGMVVAKASLVTLSYLMHPFRPRLKLRGAGAFLHFSKWIWFSSLLAIVTERLDAIFVGKFAGTGPLGVYTMAFEISNLTTTELIMPASRALFPGFAKMTADLKRLTGDVMDVLGAIVLIVAPVATGIALTAEHIIRIFLGPRWLPAAPLIPILTLFGLIGSPLAVSDALYLAIGRPALIVWRNLAALVVLPAALFVGVSRFGTAGAAWALIVNVFVLLCINFWLLRRELQVTPSAVALAIWRPVAAAALMGALLVGVEHIWPVEAVMLKLLPQLAALAAIGAAAYAAFLCMLWRLSGRPPGVERRMMLVILERFTSPPVCELGKQPLPAPRPLATAPEGRV